MERRRDARTTKDYTYDVCFSFAGENRMYVRQVADRLRSRGVRVFFDEYAQADMWGKDLYIHLDDLYQNAARYCVLFASKHYAQRVWPNHERESAQARAVREHAEYILPARFDKTRIPGLRPTVAYVDLSRMRPAGLATLVEKKLGDRPRENYFPPVPDCLFVRSKARSRRARTIAETRARNFFGTLGRMTAEERTLVISLFLNSCPTELPDNVHANTDLLRRLTGFSESKIVRLLGGLRSLGFFARIREREGHTDGYLGATNTAELEWHEMAGDDDVLGNATQVARDVLLTAADGYCPQCALEPLVRLDFGQLATATKHEHSHSHSYRLTKRFSRRALPTAKH